MNFVFRRRFWPVLTSVCVILVLLAYWGQWSTPYIEHDDWDFLLPPGWGQGYASPWDKTLSEGRWLNYLWYLGIGAHGTPTFAVRVFLGLNLFGACLLGYVRDRPWLSWLAILVAFFSPTLALLATWPAALSASALVLALALVCARVVAVPWRWVALGLTTILAVMSYAGVAPVILFAFVYFSRVERIRQLWPYLGVYLLAYALAVLLIATLNLHFHGHFGIRIENWRHPHPPHDLPSLWHACLQQLAYFATVLRPFWVACLIWLIATCLLLRDHRSCPAMLGLLLVTALVLGMDVGLAALNGIELPFRAMAWVWIALLLPMLMLAGSDRRGAIGIGVIGLSGMLVLGASQWNAIYQARKATGDFVYALAKAVSAHAHGHRQVILAGDIGSIDALHAVYANWNPELQMTMALRKVGKVQARPCMPEQCRAIETYAETQGIRALIFDYQGQTIVYFRPRATLADVAAAPSISPAKDATSP